MNREYIADYVSSGGQALRLARERSPQLVIIDAALVDMTPPAHIIALRQVSPNLRITAFPLTSSLPLEYASSTSREPCQSGFSPAIWAGVSHKHWPVT